MGANWRRWHHDAVLVDGHMDTFYKELEEGRSWFRPQPKWHIDFARLRRSGTDLQICAIYTPPKFEGADATVWASRMINRVFEAEAARPRQIRIVRKRADLDGLGRDVTGLLISIEGGLPLDGKLDMLDFFHHAGVRAMGLTHNPRNLLADGASVKRARGLTAFGRDVVRRLDALRMVIDVAHLHLRGFTDLIRIAKRPIVSSHTGLCRFLDRPRNLTDWQVKKIAETGGVIAIDYLTEHLTGDRPATVRDVVDQIESVAEMVGVDHVALGSDFDGYHSVTKGLEDVTGIPNITRELAARGWTERDVKRVLGENYLRVLRSVLA